MKIESPQFIDRFTSLNKNERADLYRDFANLIFQNMEADNGNGTAMVELFKLPKTTVNTICRGIRSHIKSLSEPDYKYHYKILTDPKDKTKLHHYLIFSKKPWEHFEWDVIIPQSI